MSLAVPLISSVIKVPATFDRLGVAAGDNSAGVEFGKVLGDAAATLKGAESMAVSGIQGHASTQQVVEAVMNAQTVFQTALSLRDKAVGAYQELSRMAI